jgi:hypothetical protein
MLRGASGERRAASGGKRVALVVSRVSFFACIRCSRREHFPARQRIVDRKLTADVSSFGWPYFLAPGDAPGGYTGRVGTTDRDERLADFCRWSGAL